MRLVLVLLCLIATVPAVAATEDSAYEQARANQPYSADGEKTCLTCHNSHPVDFILQRPHAVKGDSRTPFGGGHACEACHGPSGDHAQSKIVGDKLILPPVLFNKPQIDGVAASPVEAQNAVCLGCHQSGARVNWQGSQHQVNNVACAKCHTVHAAEDAVFAKATQPEVCFACHAQQRAESSMYSHHPIMEGKVACSDCHDPHGSAGPHQLIEFSVNETCYNCHAEKRGPLLFEHQPVREDCTICHAVHGSSQPRLLAEPQNFLCASCHSSEANSSGGSFGGAHSIAARSPTGNVFFNTSFANQRQCLNCHSQVHGSNSPSGAFFFR